MSFSRRRSEVTEATWNEIDLPNRIWVISGERTKNGKAHTVPLSESAVELLGWIKAISGGSRWLFPSPRIEDKPIDRAAVNHRLAENLGIIGVSAVRPHDLRRTGASQITAMGIPRLVVSKILNHTDREITGVYDRHTYDAEKRHALEAWGARLESVVSGQAAAGNVVPLAGGVTPT